LQSRGWSEQDSYWQAVFLPLPIPPTMGRHIATVEIEIGIEIATTGIGMTATTDLITTITTGAEITATLAVGLTETQMVTA